MRGRRTTGHRPLAALAAALLTASLALAGCSAGSGDNKSAAGDRGKAAAPAQGGAADGAAKRPGGPASGAAGPSKAPAPPAQAHIVRTAELSVEVVDVPKALTAARSAATAAGGFVGDESTQRDAHGRTVSHVVLRIPEAHYDDVLAALSGSGHLLSRKAEARDVTDQVVDVDSRIASQRASVARVRELMDRAGAIGDVVTLESELGRRQADLEALLAQQASLKDRTSLATITLALSEAAPAKKSAKDDGPGVLDALSGGWHAFVTALRWLVIVLGAVAPFAGALAALYALWRWVVRPRLPRHATPSATPVQAGPVKVPAASGNSARPPYVSSEGDSGTD
ncbi:DUF4349 domain-containing protein [Streptomyces sp. BR1]|uniref:DUF4349 domain-containing protein n=1 Tax=Streptomyces sp. BR1 TaxID=1592323 RepID=UPI00402B5E1A